MYKRQPQFFKNLVGVFQHLVLVDHNACCHGITAQPDIIHDISLQCLIQFLVNHEMCIRDRYQVDQDGNWSATAANNYMTTNLSQYNESAGNMIELVICNNDGMAEGVISALNDKGYNLGDGNCTTIPVFGVDATDAAKQLIADGKMTGTIKQDAEGLSLIHI